jgi:hypothetical protein
LMFFNQMMNLPLAIWGGVKLTCSISQVEKTSRCIPPR